MIDSLVGMATTTIMLIAMCVLGVSGEIESVEFHRGAMVFRTKTFSGVAVGGMIALNARYQNASIDHEWGHLQQERTLGALYLPIVGINSVWGHLFYRGPYYERWPESWADELGKR